MEQKNRDGGQWSHNRAQEYIKTQNNTDIRQESYQKPHTHTPYTHRERILEAEKGGKSK